LLNSDLRLRRPKFQVITSSKLSSQVSSKGLRLPPSIESVKPVNQKGL